MTEVTLRIPRYADDNEARVGDLVFGLPSPDASFPVAGYVVGVGGGTTERPLKVVFLRPVGPGPGLVFRDYDSDRHTYLRPDADYVRGADFRLLHRGGAD